ncbi:hypothetical protein B0H14DRAFT_3511185 [Mycena olivaceomarginata]|nr:hypothetical protein B0H14DRAFT_3511185 [Mycena olivaceomarginata]
MLSPFVFAAVFAAAARADHRITLRNNCNWGVGLTLSNFPHGGVDYTGESRDSGHPGAFEPRYFCPYQAASAITLRTPNDCFGGIAFGEAPCSMTEWTFDSAKLNGKHDYDISNIQDFSVPQQIIPDSGTVLTCKSAGCPCNEVSRIDFTMQAYRPGDISGTCGGTGPKDQATRVSGASGFTVV